MNNLINIVSNDFEDWKATPPNFIQRGTGFIFKPIEILLRPLVSKTAPLFEGVIKKSNEFISSAIQKFSSDIYDVASLNEEEFNVWFTQADKTAEHYKIGGCTALSAEGAGTGLGGFLFLGGFGISCG